MIKLTSKALEEFSGDLLVYLIEEGAAQVDKEGVTVLNQALHHASTTEDFQGKKDQAFLFYPVLTGGETKSVVQAKRVLFVGLGTPDDDINIRRERLRLAAGLAASRAGKLKAAEVLVALPASYILSAAEIAQCVTEGLLLGNYRFDVYKSKGNDDETGTAVQRFLLHDNGLSTGAVRKGMNRGKSRAEAACEARDMANEPGNGWTPAAFVDYAKKISKQNGLKYKVIEKSAMKKLGMGGILGVNQGSALAPKLVIVEYRTDKKNPTVLLVGKGLTFDSGGISIKPAAGMEDMKYDMCGGAAVITAMDAVAKEKLTGINVCALIPATENLSGSAALKPGDIITHYGGKTAEIINTDAEGRLILADALAYGIETYSPTAVIDLATLTGAVIIGLGHHRTGLMANNDELAQQILAAGDQAGEPLWRLPLGPEYSKQIESKVADIKNTGGKGGGSITAACYLQEFVGDTPWAHLDIAGTAWNFTEKSYVPPKGPSGTGTRTLVTFLRNWKPLKKS